MKLPRPALPRGAWDSPAGMGAAVPDGGPSIQDLMETLQATGASLGQRFGHVASLFGEGAVRPFFDRWVGERAPGRDVMDVLDDVAQTDPEIANAWLNAVLADGRIAVWPHDDQDLRPVMGVHLDGRAWVTSLPDHLTVEGCLSLDDCTSLRAFPKGLTVRNSCYARGCTSLRFMPVDLRVHGILDVSRCTYLQQIPDELPGVHTLLLNGCTSLPSIPAGLAGIRNIRANGCAALVSALVPDGGGRVVIEGTLDLSGCQNLVQLPDELEVDGSLNLMDDVALTRLPDYLVVTQTFALDNCVSLSRLPERLDAFSVWVTRCTAWDGRVPPGAVIRGEIREARHVTGIPLRQWRALHPNPAAEHPCGMPHEKP